MLTPLDRRHLLIQIKENRGGCQAVVPVHPAVLRLGRLVLDDEKYVREALETARIQFETESKAYIDVMRSEGPMHQSLRLNEHEQWNNAWNFVFFSYNGVLGMRWELDEPKPYEIGYVPTVCISNGIFLANKRRAQIDEIEIAPNVTIFYGNTMANDYLLLPREVMLEYECDDPLAQKVHEETDLKTELAVGAFCSSYTRNVPQALLMRNWAAAYNNRLLEEAKLNIN